jgi:hypothetical protein
MLISSLKYHLTKFMNSKKIEAPIKSDSLKESDEAIIDFYLHRTLKVIQKKEKDYQNIDKWKHSWLKHFEELLFDENPHAI